MRHKYIWGLCTDEVKKPIQVENAAYSKSVSTASSRVWERLSPGRAPAKPVRGQGK